MNIMYIIYGIIALLMWAIPKIIVIAIVYAVCAKLWPYIKTLLNDIHTLAEEARKKEP